MPSKFMLTLLGTTFFAVSATAGLPEAIRAYDAAMYDRALDELTYLVEEKNPTALYYLGLMYMDGAGVEKDTAKALHYFQQADAGGETRATGLLAKLVYHDETIENHHTIGLEYLKRAAYDGDAEALYELGEIYSTGDGVEKEYTYAFGYYLMAALKGHRAAQHKLAFSYLDGRGTTQDFESGIKWLARSANQGYVVAQQDLANFQATDRRLLNIPDAYAWYSIIAAYNTDAIGEEAAKRRDALAKQFDKSGDELLLKQRQAANWRPIRADESVSKEDLLSIPTPIIPGFNDPDTVQRRLSSGSALLIDGSQFGITPDVINQAVQNNSTTQLENMVETAVKNGQISAYAFYGDLLSKRFNDDTQAVAWYTKGAEKDDAYAQYQLANMYCEGRGVSAPSIVECYKWLTLAATTQNLALQNTVKYAKAVVETQATPDELKAANQLLSEYAAKNTQKKEEKSGFGGFNFF